MIDPKQARALAETARADTSGGLTARELLPDVVDEMAALLGHATEFEFHPDLGDLGPIGGGWSVRVQEFGGTWVILWAHTGRGWSKKRSCWLRPDQVDMAFNLGSPLLDDIRFTLAEALELVPGILAGQRRRALEAVRG